MKISKIIIPIICLISAGFIFTAFTKIKSANNATAKGFAVVELFTSEGCSSCPPADAVVAKIQKEYNDQPVYILAYHVDYWNRLGWRDVFSNAAFSKRQYQYSSWIKSSSVYTPQIVVNGTQEFVGSEEGTLRNAIRADEQKTASAQLTLNDVKVNGGKAAFNYAAGGIKENTTLVYAIVQHAAQTKVEAGENGGRTLGHVQIVRELESLPLSGRGNGAVSINLPKGLNIRDLEVIAFLQNQVTGEITAAFKTDLEAAKMAMAK